jgi:hypothetical protein
MGKEPQKPSQPYVKLNNGTTVNTGKLNIKTTKLKTDNETYRLSDVSEFSDGTTIYVMIKGGYVPKIYEGDFNVYEKTTTHTSTEMVSYGPGVSRMRTSNMSSTRTFVQKEGTSEFHKLNYPSLKAMIPKKDPGYEYLKVYKANKAKSIGLFAAGLGGVVAATVLYTKREVTPEEPGSRMGTILWVASPVLLFPGYRSLAINRANLHRAIAKHNGMKVK